MIYSYYNSNE